MSSIAQHLMLMLIGSALPFGQLQDSNSADLLFSKIYNSLHSSVNPPKVNGSFNVTFDMTIAQLLDLDDKKQSIELLLRRRMSWFDTRLSWRGRVFNDKLTFNTIKEIIVPNAKLWKPDLFVYNDIRRMEMDWSSYYATIRSDGFVSMDTPQIMEISCNINVKNFPYDKQTCTMKIGSWSMNGFQMNLLNISKGADLSNFDEDNEYCLIGAPLTRNSVKYPCCEETYYDITYEIILQRKPLYYEINLIVPCILILIVALFGFCLPAESGERVTVLLALSVFLQLASEHTPTQSDCIPLLSRYFIAAITMSSLCVLGSVLSLALHFRGKQDRPMGARTELFFKVLCRIVRYPGFEESVGGCWKRSQQSTVKSEASASEGGSVNIKTVPSIPNREQSVSQMWSPLPLELVDLISHIKDALVDIRLELARSRDSQLRKCLWEDAARVTDRLMLITSLAAFAVLVIVMIANRPADAVNAGIDCGKLRAAFAATI